MTGSAAAQQAYGSSKSKAERSSHQPVQNTSNYDCVNDCFESSKTKQNAPVL
jgi:hypothetical protein